MRLTLAILIPLCLSLTVGAAEPAAAGKPRYYYPVPKLTDPQPIVVDVAVYGGTPAGVTAALQARRMGKRSALFTFDRHVGGMTSGGLTATDLGRKDAIGGLALEFYTRVGKLTGFAPADAERTFREMLGDLAIPVHFEHRLAAVRGDGNRITEIAFENGQVVRAKVFVDASYEGDLMAMAKVVYHVGRESNETYHETLNGVQFRNANNFIYPLDPYVEPGKPESGLLWGISPDDPGKQGDGDRKIQAYNFRMWLSSKPDRVPFPKPDGYDAARYDLLLRYLLLKPGFEWKFGWPEGPFELRDGDCNNSGGFSTDHVGGNYAWPEADYQTRERIFQDHVSYQQGLMWFMANDPRVPEALRQKVGRFGLAKDQFAETGHWPHQLYVREARRMLAGYVMTEAECLGRIVPADSVGLASYTMDSHNVQRVVVKGAVRNEGDVQVPVPKPYPISYRAIVPKEGQCANLIVPVCLSASHIAYGSIRMEPVFMILGQSSGAAAALAIDAGAPVQRIDHLKLRARLLADKQVLDWKEEPRPAAAAAGEAKQP
jgi:hypothetical protein